ncbi:MAG: ATP-binding protein, partial [Spirochaetia bacterium]|nr:ATP-binding protein [Spirochaetia bacterium]
EQYSRAFKAMDSDNQPDFSFRPTSDDGDDKNPRSSESKNTRYESDKELLPVIHSFIQQSDTTWDDIGGLDECLEPILTNQVICFGSHPKDVHLNSNMYVLLYGSQGTGKTLIAKALCNTLQKGSSDTKSATFFNVDCASLISKWSGDSSKLIRLLFNVAREKSPSVVFFDEFEGLSKQRTSTDQAHENRIIGQLLTELDGFSSKSRHSQIMVVAATNKPWYIDNAALGRFMHMYIPLPDQSGRKKILSLLAASRGIPFSCDLNWLSSDKVTKYYSGRDLKNLYDEAVQRMIIHENRNPSPSEVAKKGIKAIQDYQLNFRPLNKSYLSEALGRVKPQTNEEDLVRYERWKNNPTYRPE